MSVIEVVNTTKYAAIQSTDEEAFEVIQEWISPFVGAGDRVDLNEMQAIKAWAIRHPSGAVSFVSAESFSADFQKVVPMDDFEKLLTLTPSIPDAEDVQAKIDRINKKILGFVGVIEMGIEEAPEDGDEPDYNAGVIDGMSAIQKTYMHYFEISETEPT